MSTSAASAASEHAQEYTKEISNLPASPKVDPSATSAASSSSSGGAETMNRCLVYVRLRPGKPQDYEDDAFKLIDVKGKTVIVKDERNYDFDGTFDDNCTQEDIFEQVGKPSIDNAVRGSNSSLLAYGQTGSGKSHTMGNYRGGTNPLQEGIIPRAARYIFGRMKEDATRVFSVRANFIQIYRDNLSDLMTEGAPTSKEKIDIRCEKEEGVTLPGCTVVELNSHEDFMNMYEEGDKRRVVAATAMNPESSRGHTALVVHISSTPADENDCGGRVAGKITFIDLAGYERFSKTGITGNDPVRKDEAKTINASLLSLGHVVTALSNGDKHIPWRNAKLTRLLQDSIGGRSRTTIMCTVGPSSEHLHESTNSLQFGTRAMAVKVQAKISAHVDYEKLAAKLQGLLDEKDAKISSLEVQLATADAERKELSERHNRDEELMRGRQREELERLRASGASAERILEVSKLFEVEIENMKEEQREEMTYQEELAEKEMTALLQEQAKLTRRKEDEARVREEGRLKELEEKLAQARGGDSTADLERCLKQLAERDAVLVSRAGERARLQALCATLIQQVKQLGGTPTHGGEFEENFVDIVQVEEIKGVLEMQVQNLQAQASDLRVQLSSVQEVASERANQVQELQDQLEAGAGENSSSSSSGAATAAAGGEGGEGEGEKKPEGAAVASASDGESASGLNATVSGLNSTVSGGGRNLVDRSEVETVRTLMQVDIDMLNCKVKLLEQQLSQVNAATVAAGGSSSTGQNLAEAAVLNNSFSLGRNDSFSSQLSTSGATGGTGGNDSPPLTARRKRTNTIMLGSGGPQQQQQNSASSSTLPSPQSTSAGGNINASSGGGAGVPTIGELKNKLLMVEHANVSLNSHVKYLEQLVDDLGGSATPAPPAASETVISVQQVVDTAADIAKAKSEELDRLMSLLDAREAVVNDQAMQIATLSEDNRRAREQFPELASQAGSQNEGAALTVNQHATQVKNFVELVRAARGAQRAAEEKLFAIQQRQSVVKLSAILESGGLGDEASVVSTSFLPPVKNDNHNNNTTTAATALSSASSFDLPSPQNQTQNNSHADPSLHNMDANSLASPGASVSQVRGAGGNHNQATTLPIEFSLVLRANDDKLLDAESKVIELESQNATLKRMVAMLETQLEQASMKPVIGLSKEDRSVIDQERQEASAEAKEAQEQLQAQLASELEEKKKIERMLDEMSKQRAKDASVSQAMEEQLEEQKMEAARKVEQDRKASQEEMAKLQQVAKQHEEEAKRLKAQLAEREKKDREQAEEAEKMRKQLEEASQVKAAKEAEAAEMKKQLEEREKASGEKDSEAEKLKKQLEENTRAMMDEQAKKQLAALGEKKESGGFFSKLKNWSI